jgi:hypothetical protein
MPSKITFNALHQISGKLKVSTKKEGQGPADPALLKTDGSDQMVGPKSSPAGATKRERVLDCKPKPESFEMPKNYQVIGATPKKTVFSKSEFIQLQKSLCPEGQPLVLIVGGARTPQVEKYVLAAEIIRRFNLGELSKEELLSYDAVLFHGGTVKQSAKVSLRSLFYQGNGLGLIDGLLGINVPTQNDLQVGTRQFLVAAMLNTGILGFFDPQLAEEIVKKVSEEMRSASLDAALLACVAQTDLKMAKQLLSWGASANSVHPDDELTILGIAIRFLNEPLVGLLLEHGADPLTESDTDVAAVELVKSAPYDKLAYLFEKFATAP